MRRKARQSQWTVRITPQEGEKERWGGFRKPQKVTVYEAAVYRDGRIVRFIFGCESEGEAIKRAQLAKEEILQAQNPPDRKTFKI
jgi:hypothetical protein